MSNNWAVHGVKYIGGKRQSHPLAVVNGAAQKPMPRARSPSRSRRRSQQNRCTSTPRQPRRSRHRSVRVVQENDDENGDGTFDTFLGWIVQNQELVIVVTALLALVILSSKQMDVAESFGECQEASEVQETEVVKVHVDGDGKVTCPVCGDRFTRQGLPGHCRFSVDHDVEAVVVDA